MSVSQPIEPIKEFQPSLDISDFTRKLRRPVVDCVGTDLLSAVVATEKAKPKTVPASAYMDLELVRVNEDTWKVVDPKIMTDVPAKIGFWAGYRTTRALAWVIDRSYGQWIARCRNEICNPTNLAEAKRQALAMAVGGIGDYQVSDPIEEFQQVSAIMEDRYKESPVVADCPQYRPEGPVLSGDVQLEYYEDGYPKLPAGLVRRRKPESLAEAA